tara:strand:+ start:3283 stop:3891 length:609 start_codon:yes stop_codon:yes gene_type:complete
MKDLSKRDILNIVKESNKETLEEYFPSDADELSRARKENLARYQSFVSSAKNFLDQITEKAKGDYENGIINDSDINYLINDHLNKAVQTIEYIKVSLLALKRNEAPPVNPIDMLQTGKQSLARYQSFILGASNFFDQIIEKAKTDYENGIINDPDIDYLINDQLERAMQAVEYVKASLIALKGAGIKPGEKGPIYPTSRYEE